MPSRTVSRCKAAKGEKIGQSLMKYHAGRSADAKAASREKLRTTILAKHQSGKVPMSGAERKRKSREKAAKGQ